MTQHFSISSTSDSQAAELTDTFLESLAETAEEKTRSCIDAFQRVEQFTRAAQTVALSAIYALHRYLAKNPDRSFKFYAENGLKIDPRTKYKALPLVKHFVIREDTTPELRTKTTYWAGAIEAAVQQDIEPADFVLFIEQTPGGIHGAYKLANRFTKPDDRSLVETARARIRLAREFEDVNQKAAIEHSHLTRQLQPGRYQALIEIQSDGVPKLVSCIDGDQIKGERVYDELLDQWESNDRRLSAPRKRVTAKRRHDKAMSRSKPIVLADDDPAMLEMRSRFPNLVRVPKPNELVLKSGEHNRKIGSHVETNKWYGFPIFTLTLPERSTCPKTCPLLKSCYANGMSQSTNIRYQPGPELTEALYRQLTILSADPKSRNGFVVRLHVLGDFPDLEYLNQWIAWLEEFPALNIFGFTSWQPDTELGAAIHSYSKANWDRFAIRTSDQTGEYGSTVLSNDDAEQFDGDGIVCAAERKVQKCCGNCGYCWSTTKPVAFINH